MSNKIPGSQMTVGDLAWHVRRSPEWVRRHSDTGEIPHERDSAGRRLFDEESIAAARRLAGQRSAA
jgi:hypothetical protein